jgi:mono/diheme cytochrome c family protein
MIPARLLVRLWFAALAAGAALAAPQQPDPSPAAQSDGLSAKAAPDAPALFKSFCAACHGENGDGNGTTKLDRPARSFKDGGFSYGNTPDAIAKTLAYGIPGSVMPSFGTTLDDAQRKLLAKYVIELGPNDQPTESPDRVMVVKDRALVARGKLPPIVEGGEEIPRGLLVGTPDGFTFAYRTDDLRLIAVYQGEFAERTDWMGRGGTQLKPLGKLVASFGTGSPPCMFRVIYGAAVPAPDSEWADCQARLIATQQRSNRGVVRYEILAKSELAEIPIATVEEFTGALVHRVGSGWSRHLRIESRGSEPMWLALRESLDAPEHLLRKAQGSTTSESWSIRGAPDGSAWLENRRFTRSGENQWAKKTETIYTIQLRPGETRELETRSLFVPKWDDTIKGLWMKELK